ncbi:MAG: InlB B-repeat-containing protein [Treponema sp.]|nr:InlB B-repeat-containing protein [Treponema sp.]
MKNFPLLFAAAVIIIAAAFTVTFAACDQPVDPYSGPSGPKSFTVTFDKNGGDTEASPKTKIVTPPATAVGSLPAEPAKEGFIFNGWNTKADGSGEGFNASTTVTADITVYAQWKEIPAGSFTVTFDKNGGDTEANPRAKVVAPPATIVDGLPGEPEREGYAFDGWNTKADGSGEEFTAFTTVTGDVTVYAQWQEIPAGSFIVTFDKNGGDTEADPMTKIVTPPATAVDSLPGEPEREGYAFDGWNTEADGSGEEFTAFTTVTGDVTVYAQWEEIPAGSSIIISIDDFSMIDEGEYVFENIEPIMLMKSGSEEEKIKTITLDAGFSSVVWHLANIELGKGNSITLTAAQFNAAGEYTLNCTFTHAGKPWSAGLVITVTD